MRSPLPTRTSSVERRVPEASLANWIRRVDGAYAGCVLLIAGLSLGVVLTDGVPRALLVAGLVGLPALVAWRRGSRWGRGAVAGLIVVVGLAAALIAWSDIDEQYGLVVRAPVGHNSDQIDFTLMSWTWSEHTIPGSTPGGPAAERVVEWYQSTAAPPSPTHLLDRWEQLSERDDEPFGYTYRAHAYPMLLGTVWKAIGYRPDLGPVVNIVLLSTAAMVLAAAFTAAFSPSTGLGAGLLLATATEPLHWAGQNMSETLSILFMAVVVGALALIVQSPTFSRFAALGIALGGLVVTKQLYLPVTAGLLVILAVVLVVVQRLGFTATGQRLLVASGGMMLLVAPWLVYNVETTGTFSALTGTAGWHDMPSAYSQEYLGGADRYRVREQTFDAYEEETGRPVRTDLDRARVGRELWFERLRAGEYWGRIPALMRKKVAISLETEPIGWVTRGTAVLAVVAVVVWGTRRERISGLLLLAVPLLLLGFLALTIEAANRLFVTSWVTVAALVGLGLGTVLRRLPPRPGTGGRHPAPEVIRGPERTAGPSSSP